MAKVHRFIIKKLPSSRAYTPPDAPARKDSGSVMEVIRAPDRTPAK